MDRPILGLEYARNERSTTYTLDAFARATEMTDRIPLQIVQPTTFDGLSSRVEDEIERAYWLMLAKQDCTQTDMPMSGRDAFKHAIRQMFKRIREQ